MTKDNGHISKVRRVIAVIIAVTLQGGMSYGQTEEELIRKARNEKEVVFWTSMRLGDAQALADGFERKYPFLKVKIFRAGGEQLVNRAIAENSIGRITHDVINAFALKVLQEKGLIEPYAAPETLHYPEGYKDPKHHWVSLYNGYNVMGYNPKMVDKRDVPKDWEDLLKPRWRGKLGMDNEEYFWYAGILQYWGEEKGRKYMKQLAKQEIQWRSGHTLVAQLMGSGEFPIAVVVYPDRIEQMKAEGQPVDWVKSTDPILVNLAPVGIAARAPHPNAAKLFMNYSISREGQYILRKKFRISAREDVEPLVPDMDTKKLRLVPLDPDIPRDPRWIDAFRRVFGL